MGSQWPKIYINNQCEEALLCSWRHSHHWKLCGGQPCLFFSTKCRAVIQVRRQSWHCCTASPHFSLLESSGSEFSLACCFQKVAVPVIEIKQEKELQCALKNRERELPESGHFLPLSFNLQKEASWHDKKQKIKKHPESGAKNNRKNFQKVAGVAACLYHLISGKWHLM